jgi:hypothetical protein
VPGAAANAWLAPHKAWLTSGACCRPRAPLQSVIAAHAHSELSRVNAVAAEVRALDTQLRAADKEAGHFNTRCEGMELDV